jgi:hypothetical protein
MSSNQRRFFIGLGVFQSIFLAVMLGWMFWDAYKAITSIAAQPLNQFLAEPILWHKVGELFLALPIGIAIAAFYMLWRPSLRVRFLQIATPFLVIGGVLNLMAAWGYSQKPATDFSRFMTYFGVVLFLFGVFFPFVLKWVHAKRIQVESKRQDP